MKFFSHRAPQFLALAIALATPSSLRSEAMLQYFNTDWNEIAQKMPELAEAGYTSLWIPPPTKGSGGLSVGYDLWDRFDLGSKDQRGSIRTRYGTEAELLRMIEVAHRFGIRVYLDNVMNHNAFDIPGFNASTPIDLYPGFVPEDFHLRLTQEGFYRKWDNTRDWNSAWQVQHLGLADLIDIAQEPGDTNENFGATEGSTFPKIKFVRQPDNPEYYCYAPDGTYVGFGPNNGITKAMLIDPANANRYAERVEDFLNRSARWIIDRTKADGFRLDAVKHVRADFFGADGAGKDTSTYGYLGQAELQYNITRGLYDPTANTFRAPQFANLRESLFDTEKPRHNPMMFGEHLGEPPGYADYFNRGMRLVDNVLRGNLNNILGNPSAGLNGLDQPGSYGFDPNVAVMHAQSHDNDYASRRELQHALYLTRGGIGLIYTDGNHQAQTLGQSGGAFPRHANTNFLGQFGDPLIPNLLYIHNQLARGIQVARWSDGDLVAYERIDKRENTGMSDGDGVTALVLVNDNFASGVGINNDFGSTRGNLRTAFPPGAYLWQYATGPLPSGDSLTGFYSTVGDGGNGLGYLDPTIVVPKGGYYVFSWRSPELPDVNTAKPAIEILQNGSATPTLTYLRKDGPDGDPNFNPHAVAGATPGSYSYPWTVPRVTDGQNLTFRARADGSAENILMELDGGVDINSQIPRGPTTGEKRDQPPGIATDVFLGYEQMRYVQRSADEKFAARNVARNIIGSLGAESYQATIGTAGFTVNNGAGTNANTGTATYAYHDPAVGAFDGQTNAPLQFTPAPQSAAGAAIDVRLKTAYQFQVDKAFLYYTTDGATFPEGARGVPGNAATQVVAFAFQQHGNPDGASVTDWWKATLPALPNGTVLRYKIGTFNSNAASVFPLSAANVALKKRMETIFDIPNFNATTALVYPHADYGVTQTGLSEGFHVLRARAFLSRSGRASVYNTFTQTFYYDAQLPTGEIKFPANNGDDVGGQQYGAVVRTDPSVTEVWYNIDDNTAPSGATNDDGVTGVANGNNGWAKASEVTPSLNIASTFPDEWRFNYVNIPASGTATIRVRLKEASSSADMSLSDSAGHYTTLTRTVTLHGPDKRMFVAFPQVDGTVVDSNYVMKVRFSKSLADGTNTQQLIDRFLIRIRSSDSASDDGAVQSRTGYSINYNVTNEFHELAFQLPNLYNGNADYLHTIRVIYTDPNPAVAAIEATRKVKAQPIAAIKNNIVTPPEVDSDGKTYQTILPDVASPTADQRTIAIRVETDTDATNVAISFALGSGTVTPVAGSPSIVGGTKVWDFRWTNVTEGDFQFVSTVTAPGGTATALRNVHILFRQIVVQQDGEPFTDTNHNGVWDAGEPFTDANGDGIYNAPRNDYDDDGLGLYNPGAAPIETTLIPLPATNSETWTNAQVHIWSISGHTNPLSPDSDGDELSDGLELGWGAAVGDTNVNTDTNGDGVPNFQPDLDPPVFNTTDNASRPAAYSNINPWPYDLNRSRTDLIAGSMTDPNKPDTDDDGVKDKEEDVRYLITTVNSQQVLKRQHFGRVDIGSVDGTGAITSVLLHPPTFYNTSRVDRSKLAANAIFLTADPNNSDTDGDGIPDGQEDVNHNGRADLKVIDRAANGSVTILGDLDDSNSLGFGKFHDYCYTFTDSTSNPAKPYVYNRISKTKLAAAFPRPHPTVAGHTIEVIWTETDPLDTDTDGDGLFDGWERSHGLDALDDGIAGHHAMSTGATSNVDNGAAGNPDGDTIIVNGASQPYTNLLEFINNTDPRFADTGVPPPAGAITIGTGTTTTTGGVSNAHEFTDWTADDLIALDPYDGDGYNNQQSDVYHGGDGDDGSRDLIAFYAHDGGSDGNFYFRVDLQDLKAFSEDGHVDIYVVINFGHAGSGERLLPDDVDTLTNMGWQAVVASYSGNNGRVYVDTNPAVNSANFGDVLATKGVQTRDQNAVNGFKKAYYNSELDAVEFSISRQALLDAGWNGLNASDLIYQVFTTKDGTQDNPVGPGNIGGRSDIRDSIRNDWIASDYYQDQQNIAGSNSVLNSWVGLATGVDNDRGKRVKIVSVVHGNQAIQPGTVMQNLVNNTASAGYYRPLDVHESYVAPLAMHITPTLASALQWARVDTASARQYRDGPALNARIGNLIGAGTIDLLGSTFSDHMLPYFNNSFNADNIALAQDFLTTIYGHAPSTKVLWTPERVSDSGVLQKVKDAGFNYTFVDQLRHVVKWFGRSAALGSEGYRINQINNTNAFVINDGVSDQLFLNDDNGLPYLLRQLLSRKSRDSQQDQVVTFVNQWEDFGTKARADAYDKNIRWLASHPWVQIVTPDQIANNQVPFGAAQTPQWGTVARGSGLSLANVSKDYIDHATEEHYDHWYFGSPLEESLRDKKFNIRSGVAMSTSYGLLGVNGTIIDTAWKLLGSSSLPPTAANAGLLALGRATIHAAQFETAFHSQTNNDLTKYSTGAYVSPDATVQTLAGFAKNSQAQTRFAALYKRVNDWSLAASAGGFATQSVASSEDVDLDGELEYLLYNDRLFAMFERSGGRMTAAWIRDLDTGYVSQVVGNQAGYAGSETEEEGGGNFAAGAVSAFRTSGFKDWFVKLTASDPGSFTYVNDYYSVAAAPSGTGWKFTSSTGAIVKTITLPPRKSVLTASYTTTGLNTLYVRFGLSPDLLDLLRSGQSHLTPLTSNGQEVNLLNKAPARTVRAFLRLTGATFNLSASDIDSGITADTVPMRNQAQTQQVEISGAGTMTVALGFETGNALTLDTDADGLPDWWETKYGLDPNNPNDPNGANTDRDGDGKTVVQEYVLGTNPGVADAANTGLTIVRTSPSDVKLTFGTITNRIYRIYYRTNLQSGSWTQVGSDIFGTGGPVDYLDNGSGTGNVPPATTQPRFYKLEVSLPTP